MKMMKMIKVWFGRYICGVNGCTASFSSYEALKAHQESAHNF